MDFILYTKEHSFGLETHVPLESIESEQEAIAKARETALGAKEQTLVAFFSREGKALAGWTRLKDKKLRKEPLDTLPNICRVGPETYEYLKRCADERRRAEGTEL